jgi:hypothetical protein
MKWQEAGGGCTLMSFTKYCYSDKVKEDEMGKGM